MLQSLLKTYTLGASIEHERAALADILLILHRRVDLRDLSAEKRVAVKGRVQERVRKQRYMCQLPLLSLFFNQALPWVFLPQTFLPELLFRIAAALRNVSSNNSFVNIYLSRLCFSRSGTCSQIVFE